MGLETTPSWISDLDDTWPLSGDPRNEGDGHLRNIKAVLQDTFPGAGGAGFAKAITATEDELNYISGVTSAVQTQLDAITARFPVDATDIDTDAVITVKILDGNVTLPKLVDATAAEVVLGRNTSGSGDFEEVTATQLLDWLGSAAQGDIAFRGSAGWELLAAGTAGYKLQTNGVGADPTWVDAQVRQHVTDTTFGSAATKSISIPSGQTQVEIVFNNMNADISGSTLFMQLGSSATGLVAAGYEGVCRYSNVLTRWDTYPPAGVGDWATIIRETYVSVNYDFHGTIILTKMAGTLWHIHSTINPMINSNIHPHFSEGYIDIGSGELDEVQFEVYHTSLSPVFTGSSNITVYSVG